MFHESARGQRRAAIEDSDVIEAEKAALENIHPFGVFAVDPPGEIQQQLVKYPLEEIAIAFARALALNLVDA